MWAQHTVRSTMLRRMLEEMDCAKVETGSQYRQVHVNCVTNRFCFVLVINCDITK